MSRTNIILVYVPMPSKASARKLSVTLLRKNLIACANILGPSESVYRWDGKVVHAREYLLLMKTTRSHRRSLEREIASGHPYDCPCILSFESKGVNEVFGTWVSEQV